MKEGESRPSVCGRRTPPYFLPTPPSRPVVGGATQVADRPCRLPLFITTFWWGEGGGRLAPSKAISIRAHMFPHTLLHSISHVRLSGERGHRRLFVRASSRSSSRLEVGGKSARRCTQGRIVRTLCGSAGRTGPYSADPCTHRHYRPARHAHPFTIVANSWYWERAACHD